MTPGIEKAVDEFLAELRSIARKKYLRHISNASFVTFFVVMTTLAISSLVHVIYSH